MKEPIGLLSSLNPALFLLIALDIAFNASSCPITSSLSTCSTLSTFCFSESIILFTGIPVHLDTILAIDSSSTEFLRSVPASCILCHFSSFSFIFASSVGISPYSIDAASSNLDSLLALSALVLSSSIFALNSLARLKVCFSFSNLLSKFCFSSFRFANSFSISSNLCSFFLDFSIFNASFSTLIVWICLFSVERTVGSDSICILSSAAASSIKSIALSGKNLSVIYLLDNLAALISAESLIVTL